MARSPVRRAAWRWLAVVALALGNSEAWQPPAAPPDGADAPVALVRRLADRATPPSAMLSLVARLGDARPAPDEGLSTLMQALEDELAQGGAPTEESDLEHAAPRMIDSRTFTRVDGLVLAIGAFGVGAAPAVPVLRRVEAASRPSTRLRARAAIAATGTADGLAVLREDLVAGGDDAWHAMIVLQQLGPRATGLVSTLSDLHATSPSFASARALSAIGGATAVAALSRSLRHRDFGVVADSATALGGMGPAAAATAPDLEALAASHWAPGVREAAAAAATTLTGRAVVAARLPDHGTSEAGAYVASSGPGFLPMVALASSVDGGTDPACTLVGARLPGRVTSARVGDECLFGVDEGEWGGAVHVGPLGGGPRERIARTGAVRALVRSEGRVFVIQGTSHLGDTWGYVSVATRDGSAWRLAPLVQLPGDVLAVAPRGGGLLVVTRADRASGEVPRRVAVAVAVAPDGTLERRRVVGLPGLGAVALVTVALVSLAAARLRRARGRRA